MSSTRKAYDDTSFRNYVAQSTKPGKESIFETNKGVTCYPDVSQGHPTNFIDYGAEQAQVENQLSNRRLSPNQPRAADPKTPIPATCNKLTSQNTLLTHPKSTFRSMSMDDYYRDFPTIDPQLNVPDYVGSAGKNTRQIVIDQYKELTTDKK